MTYRVELSEQAEADLDRLIGSLNKISPDAAGRLARNFWQAVTRLRNYPLACGLARENPDFPVDLRHLLFWTNPRRKYRALFEVREDVAYILCIRAPGEKDVRPEDVDI